MKIQPVSLNNNFCKSYYRQSEAKPKINAPAASTPGDFSALPLNYQKPLSIEPKTTKGFIEYGGELIYDFALEKGTPYTGRISSKCLPFKKVDYYKNGIKESVALYDKDGEETVSFQRAENNANNGLSKTILWVSNDEEKAELFESYDDHGALCQVEISGEAENHEKMFTRTTFDTDGATVLHNLITYTQDGKKHTIETEYKNGIRHKKVISGEDGVSIDGCTAKKIVKQYDENGQPALIEITSPKYLSENGEMWASSSKKIIDVAKKTETDYDYKTLNLKDAAASIRSFIFEEHPCSTRVKNGNLLTYEDGYTGRAYARELYKSGKNIDMKSVPLAIEDIESGNTASIKPFGDRAMLVFIKDEKNRPVKNTSFEMINGKYEVRKVEYFNEGKKTRCEYFTKDGNYFEEKFGPDGKKI